MSDIVDWAQRCARFDSPVDSRKLLLELAAEIARLRDELANCRAAALKEAVNCTRPRDDEAWTRSGLAHASIIESRIRALSPSPAAPEPPHDP